MTRKVMECVPAGLKNWSAAAWRPLHHRNSGAGH